MNTIVANIIFSIGIKFGFVYPGSVRCQHHVDGSNGSMGASLLVTLNGMRLLRYFPNNKDNKD